MGPSRPGGCSSSPFFPGDENLVGGGGGGHVKPKRTSGVAFRLHSQVGGHAGGQVGKPLGRGGPTQRVAIAGWPSGFPGRFYPRQRLPRRAPPLPKACLSDGTLGFPESLDSCVSDAQVYFPSECPRGKADGPRA